MMRSLEDNLFQHDNTFSIMIEIAGTDTAYRGDVADGLVALRWHGNLADTVDTASL